MPPAAELLYVDEHIAIMNKPSGLLVHRGWDDDDDVALFRVRDTLGSWVTPVHRLDRGTSGALLFARSAEVATRASKLFEGGRVQKRYLALVRGTPPDSGVIDHPVPKKEDGERVAALTRYRRIATSTIERCSLVEAMPETGRLHQIRRHMKHLSHPLLGDVNYGKGDINRLYRSRYGLHRLALHAHELALPHPMTDEPLCIVAPLPEDLLAPMRALGLA